MLEQKRNLILVVSLVLFVSVQASPDIYLFLDSGPASQYKKQLQHPYIKGAQIIYSWKSIEPEKGRYNCTAIKKDRVLPVSRRIQL